MRTSDEWVTSLKPHEVFVFGSNYAGRHGKGAARLARQKFGAVNGQGQGLMGNSYGIATKGWKMETLPLHAINVQVARFLRFAAYHKHLTFLVTEIGCGLAGYSVKQVRPLFHMHGPVPPNVVLPERFR